MNNEYENEIFFEEYAKMARSREGLPAAGKWHQLKPLFPPLQGKAVLGLGCGYGWHCKYAAQQGGVFLFNIEHPVFTAGVGQDWIYNDEGKPQYWPVDQYFISGERSTHFLGCEVIKQHHTLTQILMGLLRNGFALEAVEEAEPPEEMMEIPGMRDELRRPMMLLVKAIAKKDANVKP